MNELTSKQEMHSSDSLATGHFLQHQSQNNNGTNPLSVILQLMTFAEKESNYCNRYDYWDVSKDLDKHRETRCFDSHIQKSLLFIGKIGDFVAQVVSCGNGFYRTLLRNQRTNVCILIVHSYDKNAEYMKKYLEMNRNSDAPQFALIQYCLNSAQNEIDSLNLIIPSENGEEDKSASLMSLFEKIKQEHFTTAGDINEFARWLKGQNSLKENDYAFYQIAEKNE